MWQCQSDLLIFWEVSGLTVCLEIDMVWKLILLCWLFRILEAYGLVGMARQGSNF